MLMLLELLVGMVLVLVIATVDALAMPSLVACAFVGCWTIGRYAIRLTLGAWAWWINDQIERGRM